MALLAAIAAQWRAKRPPAVIGGVALLVLPALWALSAVFAPGNLTLPSASLPRWLGIDDGRGPILSRDWKALTDDPKLQAFLQQHRGNARFLLAAPNALLAAPVIIGTGQPVMAFGGFFGNDPVMSVDAFAKAVERGEVRFVVLATNRRTRDFERWVRAHGTIVDPPSGARCHPNRGGRSCSTTWRPSNQPSSTPSESARLERRRIQSAARPTGGLDRGLGALAGAAVAALQPPHQEAGDGEHRDDHARDEHQELVAAAQADAVVQRALPGDDALARARWSCGSNTSTTLLRKGSMITVMIGAPSAWSARIKPTRIAWSGRIDRKAFRKRPRALAQRASSTASSTPIGWHTAHRLDARLEHRRPHVAARPHRVDRGRDLLREGEIDAGEVHQHEQHQAPDADRAMQLAIEAQALGRAAHDEGRLPLAGPRPPEIEARAAQHEQRHAQPSHQLAAETARDEKMAVQVMEEAQPARHRLLGLEHLQRHRIDQDLQAAGERALRRHAALRLAA